MLWKKKRLYIPQLKTWLKVDDKFFFISAMNPSDLRGTRILPQALKDRIRVWINLTYPTAETELKIIKINCPEINLDDETLGKIVDITTTTRINPDVTQPASIRASISYAKMLAQRVTRMEQYPTDKMIYEVGKLILAQAISMAAGNGSNRICRTFTQIKIKPLN